MPWALAFLRNQWQGVSLLIHSYECIQICNSFLVFILYTVEQGEYSPIHLRIKFCLEWHRHHLSMSFPTYIFLSIFSFLKIPCPQFSFLFEVKCTHQFFQSLFGRQTVLERGGGFPGNTLLFVSQTTSVTRHKEFNARWGSPNVIFHHQIMRGLLSRINTQKNIKHISKRNQNYFD